MLAISSEELEKVAPYNESYGFPFPVAAGSKTAAQLGALVDNNYLPHTFLLDADGRLAWHGHPSELTKKHIKSALKGVKKPGENDRIAWRGEVEGAPEKALEKARLGELAGALAMLDTDPSPGAAELRDKLEEHVADIAKQVDAAIERRDVTLAMESLEILVEELDGHAFGADPQARLVELRSDATVTMELEADEALAKALELGERRGMKKAKKKLEAVLDKYRDTKAGERARLLLKKL